MAETEMSAPSLAMIEAHDTRISRLEDESRENSKELAEHSAGIGHLSEKLDTLRGDFKEAFKDFKEDVGGQISDLSANVSKAMDAVQDNSNRLKSIEEARARAHERTQAFKKWAIGLGAGLVGTATTYFVQQLLSRIAHH